MLETKSEDLAEIRRGLEDAVQTLGRGHLAQVAAFALMAGDERSLRNAYRMLDTDRFESPKEPQIATSRANHT